MTDTHVVWKQSKSMPQRCSPLLVGDLLFVVDRGGIATCLEAKTGKIVWKKRMSGKYSASPIYAENRIYLFNEDATTTVIRPDRQFDVVATNALAGQPLLATPAVDGNAFVIRTESYLYRIENDAAQPTTTTTAAWPATGNNAPLHKIAPEGFSPHGMRRPIRQASAARLLTPTRGEPCGARCILPETRV